MLFFEKLRQAKNRVLLEYFIFIIQKWNGVGSLVLEQGKRIQNMLNLDFEIIVICAQIINFTTHITIFLSTVYYFGLWFVIRVCLEKSR